MRQRPPLAAPLLLAASLLLAAVAAALPASRPAVADAGLPEGPEVGEIRVAVDGEPRAFTIVGGMRAGSGYGMRGPHVYVNLMGFAGDGSGESMKIRFLLDEAGRVVCSPADVILEFHAEDRVYRLPTGPDCAGLAVEAVDHAGPDGPLSVSGRFAGTFGGTGGNEAAFEMTEGRFSATVEPFF